MRCVIALLVGLATLTAGMAGAEPARPSGTLELRALLSVAGSTASRRFGEACAPGTAASVECFDVTGSGTIRGLGRVSLTSLQFVDTAPSGCAAGEFNVLGSPMRLSVAGKGTIEVSVGGASGCRTQANVLSHTRSFTVLGGTGVYSGATGAGTIRRAATFGSGGMVGTDTWEGTLAVPGLEFDLVPPSISGATGKTVRAPRGAKRVRVTYTVTARDEFDGAVPVSCRPRSGSRFRIGRTVVNCSATDRSANTATARFTITVKRRR